MVARRKAVRALPEVFLDSGIFIAALDRSDRWHIEARSLFGGPPVRLVTSVLVVSETHSWFLHRLGEEPARSFQAFLAALPRVELLEATQAHHRAALRMLDHLRGSKLTYVDASSLAFLEAKKLRAVWGTDHHLGLTGATVFPRGER